MKLLKITLPILVLATLACSKDSSLINGGGLNPTNVQKDIAQKFSAAKLPDQSDFKISEYSEVYNLPNQACIYKTTEKATITQLTFTTIEITYDRSTVADTYNAYGCPVQTPQFLAHEAKSLNLRQYIESQATSINQNLDTTAIQKSFGAQVVVINSSVEENFRGLRVQAVEMTILMRNGTRYSFKQYFSLDSAFLGRIEYNNTQTPGGAIAGYLSLTGFSIKKLGS